MSEMIETNNNNYIPFSRLTKPKIDANAESSEITYTLTALIFRTSDAANLSNTPEPQYIDDEVHYLLEFRASVNSEFTPLDVYKYEFSADPENYKSASIIVNYYDSESEPGAQPTSSKKSKIRLADAEIGGDTLNPS